jgi:hypothetical protein
LNKCQENDKLERNELHHCVMHSKFRLKVLEDLEHRDHGKNQGDDREQVQPKLGKAKAPGEHAVNTSAFSDGCEDGDEE